MHTASTQMIRFRSPYRKYRKAMNRLSVTATHLPPQIISLTFAELPQAYDKASNSGLANIDTCSNWQCIPSESLPGARMRTRNSCGSLRSAYSKSLLPGINLDGVVFEIPAENVG